MEAVATASPFFSSRWGSSWERAGSRVSRDAGFGFCCGAGKSSRVTVPSTKTSILSSSSRAAGSSPPFWTWPVCRSFFSLRTAAIF